MPARPRACAPTAAASSARSAGSGSGWAAGSAAASTSVTSPFGGSAKRSARDVGVAALDLLVQLGQLAADRHPPAGVALRQARERGRQTARRLERHDRKARRVEPVEQRGKRARPSGAGSLQTRSRHPPSPRPPVPWSPPTGRAAPPARRRLRSPRTRARRPDRTRPGSPRRSAGRRAVPRPHAAAARASGHARCARAARSGAGRCRAGAAGCASGACPHRRPRRRAAAPPARAG